RHSSKDHASGANPALRTAAGNERLLDGMQPLSVCNSLDSSDRCTFSMQRRYEATVHKLAIQLDRARAAFTFAATVFRASQLQFFAQHIEQPRHRVGVKLHRTAVHCALNASCPRAVRQARAPGPTSNIR